MSNISTGNSLRFLISWKFLGKRGFKSELRGFKNEQLLKEVAWGNILLRPQPPKGG
jgi:hypothetical protein